MTRETAEKTISPKLPPQNIMAEQAVLGGIMLDNLAINKVMDILSATDFYQVLDTSDVPGGVVNIVTGDRDHLSKTLVQHEDVDAMWYFGSGTGSYHVEYESAANMKRTWVSYGIPRDWTDPAQGEGHEFLHEAVQVKNIWVPTGE